MIGEERGPPSDPALNHNPSSGASKDEPDKMSPTKAKTGENDRPSKKVRFDWLISNRLGECGKYQLRTYILLGLPAISCAMHALSWVFLGANVNYR